VSEGSGAEPAKPLRLFVAVDVPDHLGRELLARLSPFRASVPGARWTRREGWHVTLKFLGWTAPGSVPQVEAAVAAVASAAARPFDTRITRLGAFPKPGRARVLWAGLADDGGAFAQTVKDLDDALAAFVEPEKRAFTPHLTLARIAPPVRVGSDVLDLAVGSEPFAVDRLILYRSHLSPKGASYEALVSAPLGGTPRPA
jgi:2'-5' RNA ligase